MTQLQPLARSVRQACTAGVVALGVAGLAACGGGSGSSSDSGSGSLTVGVTDAPVDSASHVYVQFSSITLKPSGVDDDSADADADANGDADGGDSDDDGDDQPFVSISFEQPKRIDLLDQQNGNSALLVEDEEIPAGDYEWIRLGVDLGNGETVIVNGNGTFDLDIPSGARTGLKLQTPFSIEDGGTLDLTIDFDLRKSVVRTGNGEFKLKPALRLVRTDEAGEIAVTATGTYVSDKQCGSDSSKQAVYVFEGSGVSPDDIDGSEPEPITTAAVTDGDGDGTYTATAAFLDPGIYTVAYACNPEDDDAPTAGSDNDDSLTFHDVRDVEVEAGETADYELP